MTTVRAVAGALAFGWCLGLFAAPVGAQCVGDCDGDGTVSVSELVLGVNIVLGARDVSACPAFANDHGIVDVAQLVHGVNNALNGCAATPTPSPTPTPSATPTGASQCRILTGPANDSHVLLNAGAFPVPVNVPLDGTVSLSCGAAGPDDTAPCTCSIDDFVPIDVPSIGFVCIAPSVRACPAGGVDCAGGHPRSVEVRSDANLGSCPGNLECEQLCDDYCAGMDSTRQVSGCTGYCSAGTMHTCERDADCAPDDGSCNGPEPVGASSRVCQCTCLNVAAGGPGRSGELQCHLGAALSIESTGDCDGSDVRIHLGESCISLTTATASSLITHSNRSGFTLPFGGQPATNAGSPLECTQLETGDLSGLTTAGAVNFFDTEIGDVVAEVMLACE